MARAVSRMARQMACVVLATFAVAAGATEVETGVTEALARGESPAVIVAFDGGADLAPAHAITDGNARAAWVYHALADHADRTQAKARQTLTSRFRLAAKNRDYVVLWIDNSIAIAHLTAPMLDALATTPGVASVRLQEVIAAPKEPAQPPADWSTQTNALFAVETNLDHIHVPQVWALGHRGAGVVVANIDDGVRHTHAALRRNYRGYRADAAPDHVYNWYDPYQHAPEPRTAGWHGTHTMGTLAGDDSAGNAIGVAPDARWIACMGFGDGAAGAATTAGLIECGQWLLAPYPPGGQGTPDPSKHADVVNNSWGRCGNVYDTYYENVIRAWIAAGIVPVFANGNAMNCNYPMPPALGTVFSPARSGKVLAVGSTGKANGVYAAHSNLGPSDDWNLGLPDYPDHGGFPRVKPNLVAPGVDIRSAGDASDDTYLVSYGTSMSAPHVAGTVALMWSAAPCLKGNYPATGTLLTATATPKPRFTDSPYDGPLHVPNQATGWGEVDALAAVNAALAYCAANAMPPEVSVAFLTPAVRVGAVGKLVVTLRNPNAEDLVLQSALAEVLPAGLTAAGPATTNCANGIAAASGTAFSLSAGARLPAQANCALEVPVSASSTGAYTQVIGAGSLVTAHGVNVMPASATLKVKDTGPSCSARIDRPLPSEYLWILWREGRLDEVVLDPRMRYDLSLQLRDDDRLTVFLGENRDPRAALVAASAAGGVVTLSPGTVVGPASLWSSWSGLIPSFADGWLGVRFACEAGTCYGYAHFRATGPGGDPATLVEYCFDPDGAPVVVAESPGVEEGVELEASFFPDAVAPREPASLRLTLTVRPDVVGIGTFFGPVIRVALPPGLRVAHWGSLSSCGWGHGVSAETGDDFILVSTEGGIPADARHCQMSVDVEGAAAGDYTLSIPAGAFTTNAGRSQAATAHLAVLSCSPWDSIFCNGFESAPESAVKP